MVLRYVPLFWRCSVLDGAKRVCALDEVFGKVLVLAVCSECGFVFIKPCKKFLPVCPIYALLQSGQVSLYTPHCMYLSVLFVNSLLCISVFWMELLLRITIFKSVFLNKLVI